MRKIVVLMMTAVTVSMLWAKDSSAMEPAAFAISFVPGFQSTAIEQDIKGFRLNCLVGRNRNVAMLDVGLLGCLTDARAYGLQLSGFYGRVDRGDGLLQIALWDAWCARDFQGIQVAGVYARTEGILNGFSFGAVNSVQMVQGLQAGLVNFAETLGGMQFGLVNYAKNHDEGVQIGLVNVMPESNVPVMAFMNFGF